MTGRPRTPTNVLELRGAFNAHPERKHERQDEPVPAGPIGEAPKWMKAPEKRCWDHLVASSPPGVLGDSDRVYLEVAAELLALKRRVGIENMEAAKLNRLETMLGKLGMNPADRSRVKVSKSRPRDNEFTSNGRRPGA
ncbi:hypothetical protein [Pseudoxanthomonas sp. CF125]|uniref:hypothetical protein n=1 Tax=Pseudoxanthomonas sp. CF125 TaxID=1855303 RepID=UPI00088FB984|nr:hypothetical protein [Pseudoxanthomonas sp. CF125]SDR06458.1 hypothetical protein SAMN05216569_2897 [Pseudoxanthomonas sp. CF125]